MHFVPGKNFHPCLTIVIIFVPRLVEPLMELYSKGRLLAFTANIRLGRDRPAVTNAVVYQTAVLSTAVKYLVAEDQ